MWIVVFQFSFMPYHISAVSESFGEVQLPQSFALCVFISVLVVAQQAVLQIIGLADVEDIMRWGVYEVGPVHTSSKIKNPGTIGPGFGVGATGFEPGGPPVSNRDALDQLSQALLQVVFVFVAF